MNENTKPGTGRNATAGRAAPARLFTVLVLVAFAAAGCATIRGFPEPPATTDVAAPEVGYQLSPRAIRAYNAENDPKKKKELRNEIIDARMAEIDGKFEDFERALYSQGIGWGVGSDWFVLALTAGAAIAKTATAKTDIAAVATAVVGGQAAFDKRALFDKTLPALMAQMVANRETLRGIIRRSETLEVADYTWSVAESDLSHFEFAGSLPGAITSVTQDAGSKNTQAAKSLEEIRSGTFLKSRAGDLLQGFWKPGGVENPTNKARIEDWMTAHGISTAPGNLTMFIRDAAHESARVQAVKDLGLDAGAH